MRFKKGQEVVCIASGLWVCGCGALHHKGPKTNEVVTCDGYSPTGEAIYVSEYPTIADCDGTRNAFKEHLFQPLADISELTELLNEVPETVSI